MGISFRTLNENEIECRIATVKKNGLTLLLYKNARVDMQILDETVGCLNWQRKHYEVKGNLHCEISIYDAEKGQWISKSDCGTESFAEKEKGESSDSFKRSGFNWGIGRELYTAPFIYIKAADCDIKENGNKCTCYDKFSVEKIAYDDKKNIIGLSIINNNTKKRVFLLKPQSK